MDFTSARQQFWRAIPRPVFEAELSRAITEKQFRDKRNVFLWREFVRDLGERYNLILDWDVVKYYIADEYGILPIPRHRVWWAIYLGVKCPDPRAWLFQERRIKKRPLEDILREIRHSITKRELQSFMNTTPRRRVWRRGADGYYLDRHHQEEETL